MDQKKLDQLCINTIRMLSIDAVQKANSGHPGLPLGAAPMAYVLWTQYLKHNPKNPEWSNRDRFVLSAGHGSMLLYSLLHLTGYDVSMDDIQQFRQWGSKTPGHPEYGLTPGVEITTGPLGQGFANGVGMAMAEAHLGARFNRPDFKVIDHYTYALVSDGDLMEGVSAEAASLAGHLQLGKLIYLYDNNHITLSASTHASFTEEVRNRFESYGWHTLEVDEGNDLNRIEKAIKQAQKEQNKPSLILVKTVIGFGSPHKQNTFEAHGSPLGPEEVQLTKQYFKWPEKDFYIPKETKEQFRKALIQGKQAEAQWNQLFTRYTKKFPDLAAQFQALMACKLPKKWDATIPTFPADEKGMATRDASEKILQAIGPNVPGLIGGSADLNTSTKTALVNFGNFQSPRSRSGDRQGTVDGGWNYAGRNIFYGIREHAMGSISNGIATFKGMIPYTATFLTFSDYMRPAIRLASLMKLPVIFVFTHDSLALGEDGPTHQSVEHVASLRAIPGLIVIRPADANESAEAWKIAIEAKNHPTVLIFTRQKVPTIDRVQYANAHGLRQGAYILSEPEKKKIDLILIATGSEVGLAIGAKDKLKKQGIHARIVSMPSWELFEKQSKSYKNKVLPPKIKTRLAIEAGVSFGWERFVGDQGSTVSVDHFGASAPGEVVMKKFGFSIENVYQRALDLVKK